MYWRLRFIVIGGVFAASIPPGSIRANEFSFECDPTCGKVCQLVCEKKKLTAVCYACECDEICIPCPSRRGCKHCATCEGAADVGACEPFNSGCQNHSPACEFCWRDWFACGCAAPRTVKVLTKYQAEKEISWYHWQVVDAASCGCVSQKGQSILRQHVYKSAPGDAKLGEILPVSDDEWSTLASSLGLNVNELPNRAADQPAAQPQRISFVERLGRFFRR